DDRVIVRVEKVGPLVRVPGKMELPDHSGCNTLQVGVRIEAVVPGADIDIVDVQENPAAGAPGDLGEKLPFRQRRVPVGHVAGDVLEGDRAAEPLLHALHASPDLVERVTRGTE